MKLFFHCAAIVGAFLLAGGVLAQSEPVFPVPVADDHPIWNDPLMDPVLVQLSAEFMVQELQLSGEQGQQLQEIEAEVNEQLLAVDNLPQAERWAREKALMTERTERVAAVLNKHQLEHLAIVKREMMRDRAAKLAIQREAEAGKLQGK